MVVIPMVSLTMREYLQAVKPLGCAKKEFDSEKESVFLSTALFCDSVDVYVAFFRFDFDFVSLRVLRATGSHGT